MPNTKESNNESNLAIYQKYLKLVYYTYDILKKFPKSEKFGLVKEIKNSLYDGFKSLIYSIKTSNQQEEFEHLNKLDVNLNLLKSYFKLSFQSRYISAQNHQILIKHITDIFNMIEEWTSCVLH